MGDLSKTTLFEGEQLPSEPVFTRGQFGRVWDSLVNEVLAPTCRHELADDLIWAEFFREYPKFSRFSIAPEVVAEIIDDPSESQSAVLSLEGSDFSSEMAVVRFLEDLFEVIQDSYDLDLALFYRARLSAFVGSHSTRYSVGAPLRISISVSGLLDTILDSVEALAVQDVGVREALEGVELALADLRDGSTSARVKVCIQRQTNLLEAVAQSHPAVKSKTLGDHVKELNSWPHLGVKSSLSSIYGFASDYPGIRHAGTTASAMRDLDSRDVIALSTLMFGYLPYLLDTTPKLDEKF